MGWVSGILVYFVIWWTALFVVLPWGIRQNAGGVEQGIKGAPENPQIKKKFLITTALSIALWLLVFILIEVDIISFRELARQM